MDMDAYEIHAHIAHIQQCCWPTPDIPPRPPLLLADRSSAQFPSAVIYDAYENVQNAYPHIFDGHLPAVASSVGSLFSLSPLPHLSDVLSTTEEERPRPPVVVRVRDDEAPAVGRYVHTPWPAQASGQRAGGPRGEI